MQYVNALTLDLTTFITGMTDALGSGHLFLLLAALFVACAFEFINGFHDTANAVATVIYTRSLRPWAAVTWSGICNFLGVLLGGTAVAMGIIKLLPAELLNMGNVNASMAMIFSMLIAAITWNLGTWYFGLPASSSHTLIGSILGIGFANAWLSGKGIAEGANWSKVADIGMALLISPLFGFGLAALLLGLSKVAFRDPKLHSPPPSDGSTPPWRVRATLIATSTGVSFAHGSNDGQKGMGLIMLILIVLLPAQFAVRGNSDPQQLQAVAEASQQIAAHLRTESVITLMAAHQSESGPGLIRKSIASSEAISPANQAIVANLNDRLERIQTLIAARPHLNSLSSDEKVDLRAQILKVDSDLGALEKSTAVKGSAEWVTITKYRKALKSLVDYVPTWVILIVALSIGLGTMVGWKRIVVTIGEKIGKAHLTYAQGASAELVAMSTIGVSAFAGLPVSTTHVLSSGIAGTMVAGKAGVQGKTVRSILLAWVLTLPVSISLSAGLFILIMKVIG